MGNDIKWSRLNVVSCETGHSKVGARDFWLIKKAKATLTSV